MTARCSNSRESPSDDALRLRALEQQVNKGKVNIIELYRAAEGMLKAEQGKR